MIFSECNKLIACCQKCISLIVNLKFFNYYRLYLDTTTGALDMISVWTYYFYFLYICNPFFVKNMIYFAPELRKEFWCFVRVLISSLTRSKLLINQNVTIRVSSENEKSYCENPIFADFWWFLCGFVRLYLDTFSKNHSVVCRSFLLVGYHLISYLVFYCD